MEPIVSFEAGRIKAVEGDSGSSQVPITIQLSSASTVDVEVDIETRTGFIEGATAGEDFQAVMNTFTIPAGQTSLAFNIEYFGDTKDESDESFGLKITDARGAEVGPNLSDYFKSIEIVNDDQIDTTTPTPPDQETPTAMPFDLNITQDDRTATISIINSGDPLANPSFDLEIGASLIGASFNETSLGGSGVLLPKVLAINGNLTVNASGSALGTYGTGSTLLTIELDVEDAGSVSINSFNGSVAGIAASADTLPSFNLLEPAPEIADFIEGSFTVGDTLSIDITNLPDWGGFLSQGTAGFQWLRDGQAILGATSDSYMITQADLGSEITAVAEYRDGNFNNRSVTDDQGEIVMAGKSVIEGTSFEIISEEGTRISEGTVASGSQGIGREITFTVLQLNPTLQTVFLRISPSSEGAKPGDFWETFFTNIIGGEPAEEFGLGTFVNVESGSGQASFFLNADTAVEQDEKFTVYSESCRSRI